MPRLTGASLVLVALVLCAVAGVLSGREGAQAASLTLTVDTTNENVNLQTCADIGFQDCSLSGAITKANTNSGVKDRIVFDVGGGDIQTFLITVGLPDITDALEIDGTTQPRATSANLCIDDFDRPCIHLQGPGANVVMDGLEITAPSDVTIKGLAITDFGGAVFINSTSDVTIARNFIGTADGIAPNPNGNGVYVVGDVTNVTIGGLTPEDRNVISGNLTYGVVLLSDGMTVLGNYIGTDKSGLSALPNDIGILAIGTGEGVLIGGDNAAERNVISGNVSAGVDLDRPAGAAVSGNYIGVNAAGTAALPNQYGVRASDGVAMVGGDSAGERNVISGNTGFGVLLLDEVAGTTVEGNYIGVNAAGDAALGNNGGMQLHSDIATTNSNAIEVRNNVISGNTNEGISYDVDLEGQIVGGRIYGNIIGLNANANAKIPNTNTGIQILTDPTVSTATGIRIDAGPSGDSPNIIAGNGNDGVDIRNQGASGTVVSGNYIGTNEDLAPGLGNGRSGVLIVDSADNLIGAGPPAADGEDDAKGNVVLNNVGWGVTFDGPNALRNTISENSIDNNTQTGIFNDDGANPDATAPVLTAAEAGSTHVTRTLASTPNAQVKIEFFRSPACDLSGFGEGRTFIGSTNVTTNGTGSATIDATLSPTTPAGQSVTATATHPDGATSEFSNCVTVTAATPSPTPTGGPSHTPTATPLSAINGDANCDGEVTIDDVLATLSESAETDPGADCADRADVDCDQDVDANDALRILLYLADAALPRPSGCPEVGDPLT